MKTIICIPNHLSNLDHLKSWEEFKSPDVEIIVVQDIGEKPEIPEGFNVTIFDHKDIEKDLGKNAWIIPSQTSACRSYGYYKAWQRKPDMIVTLDNDCYPESPNYFISGHRGALDAQSTLGWVTSDKYKYGVLTRGFPYDIRQKSEALLNHGLWSNIPDLDAPTSLHNPSLRFEPAIDNHTIPQHNFFAVCGMNLAWKTELTPAMYFGIFGPEYGFDQFDDIWAGVLVKKVLDHLGFAARSGYPSVEHRKQSNVFTNLKKQAPGMQMNENFWKAVRDIQLTKETITECYEELITKLPDVIEGEPEGWTKKFKEAALIWVNLFK